MGSDSDLHIMKESFETLKTFGIPSELVISSAHRAPEMTARYAREALDRGLKVIIAGAGGAAHLPGVIAAMTPLPVIGVPIKTETLGGVDSLYSIVQMPSGVPVATVGINAAKNAGILAAQILAVGDSDLQRVIEKHKEDLNIKVREKNDLLSKERGRNL
ncbi:MAG TPA: 5-(carboxyamino)imidazole ribonucleotide mutase [Clostridia bacterium]|nr:5-(carboxyamino)imidazole ribonucleotide mutase [Clostridia bacterium]